MNVVLQRNSDGTRSLVVPASVLDVMGWEDVTTLSLSILYDGVMIKPDLRSPRQPVIRSHDVGASEVPTKRRRRGGAVAPGQGEP